jgi:hypothetical protein
MNAFLEHLLYKSVKHPKKISSLTDVEIEKQKELVSQFPVEEESAIIFKVKRHLDGKYSFEVRSEKSNDEELDAYAKWLAGSFARSLKKFDEIASVSDPEDISKSTFQNTLGEI